MEFQKVLELFFRKNKAFKEDARLKTGIFPVLIKTKFS